MTTYYELLENGTIGRSTPNAKVAAVLGLTLTSKQEIVYGFDGRRYFKGQEPTPPEPTNDERRSLAYPSDADQLDMLYHDIESGLLGESAKTSSFYLTRKAVKETYPKEEKNEKYSN